MTDAKQTPSPCAPPYEREDDAWLYDELMTPQPDAAREFFREQARRLAERTPPILRKEARGG